MLLVWSMCFAGNLFRFHWCDVDRTSPLPPSLLRWFESRIEAWHALWKSRQIPFYALQWGVLKISRYASFEIRQVKFPSSLAGRILQILKICQISPHALHASSAPMLAKRLHGWNKEKPSQLRNSLSQIPLWPCREDSSNSQDMPNSPHALKSRFSRHGYTGF